MSDAKDRKDDAPCFTTRITSFRERAQATDDADEPRPPKLPPAPGAVPDGGPVDPDRVVNRKKR